ncbi:MAG: hypothetical protein WBD04_05350, partial [Candidatus Omnitrophota bacterium]
MAEYLSVYWLDRDFLQEKDPQMLDFFEALANWNPAKPTPAAGAEETKPSAAAARGPDLGSEPEAQSLLVNLFTGRLAWLKNLPFRILGLVTLSTPVHEAAHLISAWRQGVKADWNILSLFTGKVDIARGPPKIYGVGHEANFFMSVLGLISVIFFAIFNYSAIGITFSVFVFLTNLLSFTIEEASERGDLSRAEITTKELFEKTRQERLIGTGIGERYPEIKKDGYALIGIDSAQEKFRHLKELTGKGFLAFKYGVYSPLEDRHLGFEFTDAINAEMREICRKIKKSSLDSMRILVIGTGTGIDALAVYHQAKHVHGINTLSVDAIDIDPLAIENTEYNTKLAGKDYEEAINAKLVQEGKEFKDLASSYDLVVFNAPNAVFDVKTSRKSIEMPADIFTNIIDETAKRLSPEGIAVIAALRSAIGIFNKTGLDYEISGAETGVYLKKDTRMIFRLTRATSAPDMAVEDSPAAGAEGGPA